MNFAKLKEPAEIWRILRVSHNGERYPVPDKFFSKEAAKMAAEKENDGREKWATNLLPFPGRGMMTFLKGKF